MDYDAVAFNAGTFLSTLFLLEYAADKFVDHTAIVARRLGVSEVFVGLLTAGAEWEELAVVISSVAQNRASLALGNVYGSAISNILGAFSLGLLFQSVPSSNSNSGDTIKFDRSSKAYSAILLILTSVVGSAALWDRDGRQGLGIRRWTGGALIAVFVVYIGSIGLAIYRGMVLAPMDFDSDSDSESDDDTDNASARRVVDPEPAEIETQGGPSETSPLLTKPRKVNHRPLYYHLLQLFISFPLLSLSGYLLSHTAASLADAFHLSGTVVGMTIVSFATTLPEKFIAVLSMRRRTGNRSGKRHHEGILVANTVGSNVFLLTLCLGAVLLSGTEVEERVSGFEVATLWGSSAALCAIVFLGGARWTGAVLVVAYLCFLVLEFTWFRR